MTISYFDLHFKQLFPFLLISSNNSMMSVPGLLRAARCLVRDQTARHRQRHSDNTLRDGKCLTLARTSSWDVEMYLGLVEKALRWVPDIYHEMFPGSKSGLFVLPFPHSSTDGIRKRIGEAWRTSWIKLNQN